MVAAILLTIISELAFTFYVSVCGLSNFTGHLAKILSCFLIYRALIRSGLTQPYDVLFKAWKKVEQDFRQVVEAVPISIMNFDADGIVTYVNPFHLQAFGAGKYRAEFFLGRKIHELPGIVKAGISRQLAEVLNGVPVTLPDVYFPLFTGGHSGFQSIKAIPFMRDGMVTGGCLLREDVSQLRRHEQRFARVLATTSDGFWLVDKDGSIRQANNAAAKMLGYPPDGLNGMQIQDIEAAEDTRGIHRHIEKIMHIGHDRFETRHRCRDGHLVDVEVSASFMADGEGTFVVFLEGYFGKKAQPRAINAIGGQVCRGFSQQPDNHEHQQPGRRNIHRCQRCLCPGNRLFETGVYRQDLIRHRVYRQGNPAAPGNLADEASPFGGRGPESAQERRYADGLRVLGEDHPFR